MVAEQWLLILAGITSGVLLLRGRAAGRWLALALSVVLLGTLVILHVGFLVRLRARYPEYWVMLAEVPRVLIRTVLDVAFYAGTIVFLARRRAPGGVSPKAG